MKKSHLIICTAVFILWFSSAFSLGVFHEPWRDEAQAWLIARDSSFFQIIMNMKYEGSPALWHFLLKVFTLLHFPYEALFLIPLSLSAAGVYLLLYKSKLPMLVKCISPFTFFIFYQYTAAARCYSLLLPVLAVIALVYKDRLKNPILYCFMLILLLNINFYSFITAFILLLFYVYDAVKSRNINKKTVISAAVCLLFFVITALLSYKAPDCSYEVSLHMPDKPFYFVLYDGWYLFQTDSFIIKLTAVILLYVFAAAFFCRNAQQLIFAAALNFSVIIAMSMLICRPWHLGHIFLIFLFTIWILCTENNVLPGRVTLRNIFYILFIIVSSSQLLWSYQSFQYEIYNQYSGGKRAAEFIKQNNLNKYNIEGYGLESISVQPYFSKNIYTNQNKSYWEWTIAAKKRNEENINCSADAVVLDNSSYKTFKYKCGIKNFNIRLFSGSVYMMGQECFNTNIVILVNKGINK